MGKLQDQINRLGISEEELSQALASLQVSRNTDRACQRCEWWVFQGKLEDSGTYSGECRLHNRFQRRFANDWCSRFAQRESTLAEGSPEG